MLQQHTSEILQCESDGSSIMFVPKDQLSKCLGDMCSIIAQTLAEKMGVMGYIQSSSTQILRELIVDEVTEKVNDELSSLEECEKTFPQSVRNIAQNMWQVLCNIMPRIPKSMKSRKVTQLMSLNARLIRKSSS